MIAEHAVNQALKKLVPALHKLLGIRSVIVLPLFSDGQPIGLVNISRDKPFTFSELKRFKVLTEEITTIVKRKMIEESLEKSEKQLRLITESARDIILMQDLDGKYLYYNAPPYYGLKADDVVGKTPYDFFEPEVAERIINRNKKVAKLAKRITEIEQINWQGETMYFSAEVTPVIDSAGKTAAITTILRNITELIEAEKELAKEKAAKEKLAQKVLQTQEAERKKIAIEVHDTLLQQLLAMSSWLSAIKVAHPHLDKPLQEKLDKFANTLRKAIKNSRFLISDLRPLLLETRGLPHALKEFVGKRCSEAKVECVLQIGKIPKIDENLEITIFRIVQEATLNALRHAQPSKIEVSLSSNKENITAKIKDNGRGFDYNSHKFWEERMATHLGITAMKERAAMFGGNLKIESSEEAGTEVIATFPLKKRRR
jgi:PAS domain S-box-containing protein